MKLRDGESFRPPRGVIAPARRLHSDGLVVVERDDVDAPDEVLLDEASGDGLLDNLSDEPFRPEPIQAPSGR